LTFRVLVLDNQNQPRAQGLVNSIKRAVLELGGEKELVKDSDFDEIQVEHCTRAPIPSCHFALLHASDFNVFEDDLTGASPPLYCQFSGGGAPRDTGRLFWIQPSLHPRVVNFDDRLEDWRDLVRWAVRMQKNADHQPLPRILCAAHEAAVSNYQVVLTRCVVYGWTCKEKSRVERLVREGDLSVQIGQLKKLEEITEGDAELSKAIAALHEAASRVSGQGESDAIALSQCATRLEELARQRLSSSQPIVREERS